MEQQPECNWCGSTNVKLTPYDFGVDGETGYHDSGNLIECLDCGKVDFE